MLVEHPRCPRAERNGRPGVLHRRLCDFGFTTLDRAPAEYGLGLTLGNAEARLLDLTNAYAALARLGDFRPWRVFAGDPPVPARRAADERACWLLADILSDNAARIPSFGTTSPLRFDFPVACKTGTSTDYRDNWAIGYTPEFTVGVWVGNFNGSPMHGVSGVPEPRQSCTRFSNTCTQGRGTTWYPCAAKRDHRRYSSAHRPSCGGQRACRKNSSPKICRLPSLRRLPRKWSGETQYRIRLLVSECGKYARSAGHGGIDTRVAHCCTGGGNNVCHRSGPARQSPGQTYRDRRGRGTLEQRIARLRRHGSATGRRRAPANRDRSGDRLHAQKRGFA
jgi:membrane peptidoglycan carboxypeptidase